MNFHIPTTDLFHYGLVFVAIAISLWLAIRILNYTRACNRDKTPIQTGPILRNILGIIAVCLVSGLLMSSPEYERPVAEMDTQVLPGGVTEEMVLDAEPEDPHKLAADRKALKAAELYEQLQERSNRSDRRQQDLTSYRESMGLTDTTQTDTTSTQDN